MKVATVAARPQLSKRNLSISLIITLLTGMLIGMNLNLNAQNAISPRYYLIAGSFSDLQSANELADVLRVKNYQPRVLLPNGDPQLYRVSIYQGTDKVQLENIKKQIPGGSKYWIFSTGNTSLPSTNSRIARPTSSVTTTTPENATYHLILGSFPTLDAAQRSQVALSSQGYEPYLLGPDAKSNNYRIAVYRSNNYQEVKAYQENLRRMGRQDKGWIHKEAFPTSLALTNPRAGQRVVTLGTFHLIAGSFNRFNQAEELTVQKRAEGYNALVLPPVPGKSVNYRVSIYQGNTKQAVEAFNKQLKAQGKKTGWVLQE
ncbi:MAG: SPOR domain-containing protein [Bacteroidota bacterium]